MDLCSEVIICKKINSQKTYFIFRNLMEVEFHITDKKTIKTSSPLFPHEMEYIRKHLLDDFKEIPI